MKYHQRDFNGELIEEIKDTELALKDHIERLLNEHKSVFAKKNMNFDARFDKEGNDPFQPGYCSSISIGISDESGELTDLHIIKIWECDHYFLGVPISKNIPGNKIIGELLEESFVEVKVELKEYIEELLVDLN